MKFIKTITTLTATALLALSLMACSHLETPKTAGNTLPTAANEGTLQTVSEEDIQQELHHVKITVANYGNIEVELNATAAPITVANFLSLASSGFYDGLTFHRIINGFMIQGGDPEGNGLGGSGTEIHGEFAQNGYNNPISHVRGTISMARNSISMDSASSQFFIVQTDALHLDGSYAAFGTVTSGMEIVDRICQETPVTDDNGTVLSENQPVITSIEVID